jgi:hypothetical protein
LKVIIRMCHTIQSTEETSTRKKFFQFFKEQQKAIMDQA